MLTQNGNLQVMQSMSRIRIKQRLDNKIDL